MERANNEVNQDKLIRMSSLIQDILKKEIGQMFVCYNKENAPLYTTVFCSDSKRSYYLFGAGDIHSKERYKGSYCLWESFRILASKYNVEHIDLEGVNSPDRGRFKLSFGGDLRPYYEVSIKNRNN